MRNTAGQFWERGRLRRNQFNDTIQFANWIVPPELHFFPHSAFQLCFSSPFSLYFTIYSLIQSSPICRPRAVWLLCPCISVHFCPCPCHCPSSLLPSFNHSFIQPSLFSRIFVFEWRTSCLVAACIAFLRLRFG